MPYSYRSLIFLEEQFYVLKRGCSVNNLFFPMWDDALPLKSTADVYVSVRNHLANNLLTSFPQRSRWTTYTLSRTGKGFSCLETPEFKELGGSYRRALS